ncbi:MAG: hypothetical protein ACE1ZZ_04180, partial [Dehalococcoidia bacterium]
PGGLPEQSQEEGVGLTYSLSCEGDLVGSASSQAAGKMLRLSAQQNIPGCGLVDQKRGRPGFQDGPERLAR